MRKDGAAVRSGGSPVPSAIGRRGMFAAAWAIAAAFVMRKRGTSVEATSGAGADGVLVMGSNGLNAPNSATAVTLIQTAPNFPHNEFFQFNASAFGSGALDVVGLSATARGTAAGLVGRQGVSAPGGYQGRTQRRSLWHLGLRQWARSRRSSSCGRHGCGWPGYNWRNRRPGPPTFPTNTANGVALRAQQLLVHRRGPGRGRIRRVRGFVERDTDWSEQPGAAGGAAVVGATNGVAGAFAAAFYGPVIVGGDFTVFGAKSAAVPHPDGSHRRLYCVESPESWFEDFGKSRLDCGEVVVPIDPDFAAVADLQDYHVFVTPYEDHDLRVSEQTPTQFTVRAKVSRGRGTFFVARGRQAEGHQRRWRCCRR